MPDVPFSKNRNLPSTYQEVLRLLRAMYDEVLPKLELLSKSVFNDNPKSDVVVSDDPDGKKWLKALGITINVESRDVELVPAEYIRDVTFELKNRNIIGLLGKEGFAHTYTTLITMRANRLLSIEYPTWQVAIGDIDMAMYFRTSKTDGMWNDWIQVLDVVKMLNDHADEVDKLSHRQFVQAENQPTDQEEGDYWLQPIFPSGYFFQNVSNPAIIEEVDFDKAENYLFVDLDGSGTEHAAGTVNDYSLVMPEYDDPVIPDPGPDEPIEPDIPTIYLPFYFELIDDPTIVHQATNKDLYLFQNLDGTGLETLTGPIEDYMLVTPEYPDIPEPPGPVDPEPPGPDIPTVEYDFRFDDIDGAGIHQATNKDVYLLQNLDGSGHEEFAGDISDYKMETPEYNDPDPPQPPVGPDDPDEPVVVLDYALRNLEGDTSSIVHVTTGDPYIYQDLGGSGSEEPTGKPGDYLLVTPEYNDPVIDPDPDPDPPPITPPTAQDLPFRFEDSEDPTAVHQVTTADEYMYQSLDGSGAEDAVGEPGSYMLADIDDV